MIPYGRQDITEDDLQAVRDVLLSDFLTQGPQVPRFEQAVARHVGARHALAVNSATSALHIACMALGVGPGDWVWTTPITFVASANCALYCGASVDFVDIDSRTYNLSPEALAEKLKLAEQAGRLPKVVIPVHLSGQSCDMEAIWALSRRYGFKIIEDASHAIGGKYKENYVGCCEYSDITVFSFHPVKIITTAEGGMALTNDDRIAERLALFRSHGVTRDQSLMTHSPHGPWYYQQVALGYNYRMTEIQAALGLSQLNRLEQYVARRHSLARQYDELLKDLPLRTPWQHPDAYSGLHLYIVRLRLDEISRSRLEVFEQMRAREIGVNVHYIPVHTQPFYREIGFAEGQFPNSEQYYAEALSLPMYPTLSSAELERVCSALRNIVR